MKINDHFMKNFSELLCIIQFLQSLSKKIDDVITQCGKSELRLKQTQDELNKKNIALREVFAQIELEKRQIKDSVEKNVDRLILPLLNELENKTDGNKDIFILLRENLKAITSSFGRDISSRFLELSQRELEICNMVKNGFSNKEIAQSLTLSLLTIEKHRQRIRKKLGITHEKINLATYLQNL